MLTTRGIAVLLLLVTSSLHAQSQRAPQPRVAIVNVAVIDATGGPVQHHKTGDAYFALADEARKQSIPFVGHVPRSVSPLEASNAGQASFEHIQTIFEGQFPPKPDSEPQLFAAFAKNGTAFDPTLVAYRGSTEAKNVDPEVLQKYPDLIDGRRKFFARFVELVGMMNREHVILLAGTDLSVNFKWISPGASLHDELELLVAAGLSPMEALQAATRNPGRLLHVDAGTIEVGKRADLVILDANPLDDIRNVRRIHAVVLGREAARPVAACCPEAPLVAVTRPGR